jgi:hypothetical protein
VHWEGRCSLSGSLPNHTDDLTTDEPGCPDASFRFAAHDITPVASEAKRPYAVFSKALGFYLINR